MVHPDCALLDHLLSTMCDDTGWYPTLTFPTRLALLMLVQAYADALARGEPLPLLTLVHGYVLTHQRGG